MSGEALQEFREGVAEVRVLLRMRDAVVSSAAGHKVPPDAAEVNALCRSSVVLLVSHFESFLKGLAEEFIDGVSTGNIPSRSIPQPLRELYTIPLLKEIVSAGNESQRAALLKKNNEIQCLWNLEAKPSRGLLKPHVLSRKVTSAKPEVIDEFFRLMGEPNKVCLGEIDIQMDGDEYPRPVNIRLMLEDVVKCRNDIAHGNGFRVPTVDDVDRYVRQLEAFAARLQAKMEKLLPGTSA